MGGRHDRAVDRLAVAVSTGAAVVLSFGLGVLAAPGIQVGGGLLAARIHDWNLARGR